ncbi:Aminopeptidase N [Folsomia candida]|uniref:Aminopeptidase n=1 Tax=Folsomia candida TaxID=158441 RepID=A0A226ENZ7_FOLCA|nr:Aminopeptidase N [Folsomia candida]
MKGLHYFLGVILIITANIGIIRGQTGLQVDFESGYPLPADGIDKGSSSILQSSAVGPLDDQTLEWRLPRDIMPEEYDLTITPILDEDVPGLGGPFTAPGEVTIALNVLKDTDKITLHLASTAFITLTSYEVIETETGTNLTVLSTTEDVLYQFKTFNMQAPLVNGTAYHIRMTFIAIITNGLDGLYRSAYVDPYTNTTKYIATTQMEALHARQMFPCFDEPAFKAKFFITIGRRTGNIALTTTQSLRNRTMAGFPGWQWEEFAPTGIKMPTYLLALIVSEFTYEEAPSNIFSKVVRTYAPAHYIDQDGGVYAAQKAAEILSFFESYYVEKYPLGKMDSAAVPSFFFGAMENYGLNIYRESALLYIPAESTETERYSITRILAHELGFATYVAQQGGDVVAPEFKASERWQNDAVQNSMQFDARSDYSHSVKIDDNAWITAGAMTWFDRMAYEKAGSLIRMMKGFLGEETLRNGLLKYLKDMQFQAAIQDDLFERLTEAAKNDSKLPRDLTMGDIMNTWTLQPGFPLLRVSVSDASGVLISQERFLNNEVQVEGHINQDTGLWHIPMAIATRSQPNPNGTVGSWLHNDVAMQYFLTNTSEWFVVNAGGNGFYRVLYDAPLTQLIQSELLTNHDFITSRTRSQLLDDYFNAAWQKHINIATALGLMEYLGNEREVVVWNTVLTNLRKPFNLLSSTGFWYTSLRFFLLPRLQSAVSLTGGVNNTALPDVNGGMPVIRNLQFLDWLCGFEDPECISYSTRLVTAWAANPSENPIRRDIKPVVYCAAVAGGGDTAFNFIHSQYILRNITVKQQGTLLNALACTKELPLIARLLEETLLDTGFYNQSAHVTVILSQLARNPLARAPLVNFLRESATTVESVAALGASNVITALATYTGTQIALDDIKAYIDEVTPAVPNFPVATRAAVTTIEQNIAWVADFAAPMSSFFEK